MNVGPNMPAPGPMWPPVEGTFRSEGDYWTFTLGSAVLRLRDSKGLRYLSRLLAHPGEEVGVVALVAAVSARGPVEMSPEPLAQEDIERVRSAVTKRIRDAIARIERHHPTLGQHLRASVHTGACCVYRPDPMAPVAWRLG